MIFFPMKTSKITSNIYTIRTMISSFYIYDTGNSLIAFDTGINSILAKKGFKKLNINPEDVTHVFLTHSDYDHVGGLSVFKNAKIYISEKEEPLITKKQRRMLFKYNSRIDNVCLLKDEEIVEVDNTKVKIIFTSGHTPGSAIYSINDNVLVTGDTIRLSGNKILPFLFLQNMNHKENKETVSTLKNKKIFDNVSIILTGHTSILKKDNID